MPNAKDSSRQSYRKILLVGNGGSGKSTQMWSLPGKKFAYLFDPNAFEAIDGLDIEYEEFLPSVLELDSSIKGFNRDARPDDKAYSSKIEPTSFNRFIADINSRHEAGFFDDFAWLCFDSLTYLSRACMDRQLWINRRFGKVEDIADYRIVGSKLSDVFRPITALPINVFCTGHITEFQDEKTKKITTQLMLPGGAKTYLPLQFTDIWESQGASTKEEIKFIIKTRPEQRVLQTIRSSIKGLEMYEDVTIKSFTAPEKYGLGRLLNNERKK